MRLRPRLSYANVMVTLLAVLVLGSGAAYAGVQLAKDSVGTRQLKKGAVTGVKVKDGTLRRSDFAAGLVPATGPAGPPGPQGPQGPQGPRGFEGPPGASHVFQASGEVNFDKFSSSPFGSTVVTLAVPPGSYFATATATVDNVNATASVVSCRLINGNGGSGSQAVTREGGAATAPANMTLAAGFTVTAGQALNLQCWKSVAGSGARVLAANIVAVGVTDVTGSAG